MNLEKYNLSILEKIQGDFEKYLEDTAVKTAKRMRQYLTQTEYAELIAQTQKDIEKFL